MSQPLVLRCSAQSRSAIFRGLFGSVVIAGCLIAALIVLSSLSGAAFAQDPTDEETQRLQREKERAELEAAIAKAEKEQLKHSLPDTTTQPLAGTTKLDGALIESSALAYLALDKISAAIIHEIQAVVPKPSKLLVHNQADVNSIGMYKAVVIQLEHLQARYVTLLPEERKMVPLFGSPVVAGAVLRSILDVTSLFRTETEIKAASVAIEEAAVVAALSRACGNDCHIYYPALYLPFWSSKDPVEDSPVLKLIRELYSYRPEAEKRVRECEAKKEACEEPEKGIASQLKALNLQMDKLVGSLITLDEKESQTALTLVLKAERFSKLLEDEGYLLQVKASAAGGNNRTTRNLWTSFGSAILSHSGGVVVTYLLFGTDGAIVKSGSLSCVSKYKKFGAHEASDFLRVDAGGIQCAPTASP